MATPKPMPSPTLKKKLKNPEAVAERLLAERIKAGKVKNLTKARNDIARKTGVWPNGMTD
jgi:hypothetical protein